jgi:predicted aspartyl protease
MLMIPRAVAVAMILISLSASTCQAELVRPTATEISGCGSKLLGKIPVATLNRVPFVSVSANAHSVTLILDTGAERTVLTPEAAMRINAQRPRVEFQRRLRGVGGDLASHEVELHSFSAGSVTIPWRRVLVAAVRTAMVFPTPLDGLLGGDILSDFDLDIDLPGHLIGFYRKQTCPTAAPNWAGPYSAISTGLSPGGHFFFPVQLDGHRLTAIIDTGSQTTVLKTASASAAGVTEAALSRDRAMTLQGVAGDPLASHIHRFARLDLGGIVVRNPNIVVADLRSTEADIVLGVDFVSSRRLWLSYGSRRIFVSSR